MNEPHPTPTYEDPEESAWDPFSLHMGNWGYVVLHDRAKKLPEREFLFGFGKEAA